MLMSVRITHAQFDTDTPPAFEECVAFLLCEDNPVDIQDAVCRTLEFDYGYPVDYAEWEYV